MPNKKILILNGHPDKASFCYALADAYAQGSLAAGHEVEVLHLIDLDFDPILRKGYRERMELEEDLVKAQAAISAADHLVLVYPNWWGTYPALLKGFIDRVFLPKYAFKYRENSPLWDGLLGGKSARLLVTMDSPWWYYWLFVGSPGHRSMQTSILKFCGIKPVKISAFSPIKTSTEAQRKKWLAEATRLGKAGI